MKRDLAKDRERLREYDEKGSMAALGFAHGAIEHYFDRTEQAEKRVAELEEALREAICEIGQSCGGCGDYKEDKCISYRDCWVKDVIRVANIALRKV